jgi:protein SCO1
MRTSAVHPTTAESRHAQPARRGPGLRWVWYILLLIPLIAIVAFATLQPVKVLPRIGLAPSFHLIDHQGQPLISEDLRGSLVLYTFTYTACTPPCPQTDPIFQRVQQQLPHLETYGLPVQLVTISFDPARDRPAQLAAYAQGLGVQAEHWRFATGDPQHLKHVIGGGFGVYYEQSDEAAFTFDPTIVLVDGLGIVRAKYRNRSLNPAILQRDLELVAVEVARSQGPLRLAYEAAHLFLCYPKS